MTIPQIIKKLKPSCGQTLIEYAVLLMIVMAGMIIMGPYVIRSWHAHVKGYEDSVRDSINDPIDQTSENPRAIPRCDCEYIQPDVCKNPTAPCCGDVYGSGCAKTEETKMTWVCTPSNIGCIPPSSPPPLCVNNDKCCPYKCNDPNGNCCGQGTGPNGCNGNMADMYLVRTCDSGPVSPLDDRCIKDFCTKGCLGVTPDLSDPHYKTICDGDQDNVFDDTPWTTISEEGCSDPDINDTKKCQVECKSPFTPYPFGQENGESCKCAFGNEKCNYDANGNCIPVCECPMVEQNACTGDLIDNTGCAADVNGIATEGIKCENPWACCVAGGSGEMSWSSEFYENPGPKQPITSPDGWKGRSCSDFSVMIGIQTINLGVGGNNKWRIQCTPLPPTCFTGNVYNKTAYFATVPNPVPTNPWANPPIIAWGSEDNIVDEYHATDQNNQPKGLPCRDINNQPPPAGTTGPPYYVMVGAYTHDYDNSSRGGFNKWFVECAEIKPECLLSNHTPKVNKLELIWYEDMEQWVGVWWKNPNRGSGIGGTTPACSYMRGLWTERIEQTGESGHDTWLTYFAH